MDEKRIVVYTAGRARDADLLTMRLARAGIDAAVVQGPAEAPAGGLSARRVVVAEQDAGRAAEIVRQFDEERPDAGRIEADGATGSGEPPGAGLEDPVVIYTAATPEDADFLTNLLAEAGIEAAVSNEGLQGGVGGAVIGWSALVRVVVPREHAEVARQLALEFDHRIAAASKRRGGERLEEEEEVSVRQSAVWPRCPQCDALRTTKCPVCETAGTDFPQADREFLGSLGPHDEPSQAASCGCGSGGCSGTEAGSIEEEEASCPAGGDGSPDHRSETDWPELVLMCPTCDEPFVPEYPRRCEWCGHEFATGYEVEPPARLEQVSSRAIAVVLGLLALLAGVMLYFMLLFPAK